MKTNRALGIRGICKRLFKCANEDIFLEATHGDNMNYLTCRIHDK